MKQKKQILFTLVMAIIMMAMSSTRMLADDLTPLTSAQCNELGLDATTYTGYYAIGSASDLAWFANKVNTDNATYQEAKAVLTANIDMSTVCHAASEGVEKANWTPIGSENNPYKGIFDGNGNMVEGLYYDGDGSTIGFVGCLANGTVQNLTVNGSFRSTSVYGCIGGIAGQASGYITNCTNQTLIQGRTNVGGIAGKDNGSLTVTGCSNHKDVKGAYQIGVSGGVGGIIGTIEKGNSSISNCYNTGNIGDGIRIGGIIGHITATATVQNAYSAGTVTENSDAYKGAFVGKIGTCYTTMGITQWTNATATFTNCYYDNTKCSLGYCSSSGNHNNKSGSDVSVTGKSTETFASGEICYLLNNSTSDGTQAWYQKLTGEDANTTPVLTAAADGSNTVYYGYDGCEATEQSYGNHALHATQGHNFVNGTCTLCGLSAGDLNGDGNITIADVALLIQLLKQGDTITNPTADVNGDGTVNLDDVEALRSKVLEVDAGDDTNLLAGVFTVNASGKKVKFTKANLWCNTTTSPVTYAFETNQYNFPVLADYTSDGTGYGTWLGTHVGHFFWAQTANEAYIKTYGENNRGTTDKLFCDEDNKLTVSGTSDLYVLSAEEWHYLTGIYSDGLYYDNVHRSDVNRFANARVNGVAGLLIFPDGYNGTVSGDGMCTVNIDEVQYEVDYPSASIPEATWADMEAAGVVFLPAAGCRGGNMFANFGNNGYYWSSTLKDKDNAYILFDNYGTLTCPSNQGRKYACSIRLVKTVQ